MIRIIQASIGAAVFVSSANGAISERYLAHAYCQNTSI